MKVEEMLADFGAAARALDASALVTHFDFPCVILRDSETELYLSRDQMLDRIDTLFTAYDRLGVVSLEFTVLQLTPCGDNSAVAHIRSHTSLQSGASFFLDEHLVLRLRGDRTLIAATITPRNNRFLEDLRRGTGAEAPSDAKASTERA